MRTSSSASTKRSTNAVKGNNSNNAGHNARHGTKKEKAIRIYEQLVAKGKDRQAILARFIKSLDMNVTGASTYYQNCRTAWHA